ncbi:MAG: pyruvate kinase [bacterium]
MKRTKIVCTIGPACDSAAKLRALIKSGMSMARLNFSHGTHAYHAAVVKRIRAAARLEKVNIAVMQDLQGPKIRVGVLPDEGIRLTKGEELTLTTKPEKYEAKKNRVSVSYAGMHKDLKKGDRLLLDDGLLELEVLKITDHDIHTKIIVGGLLTSHKGVNVPTAHLHVSPLTQKDLDDLKFGLKLGVDWIALSFVTSAAEVIRLKKLIHAGWKLGEPEPKVIVKVEKHEAIEHFDEILKVTDGVMVARGDLGIETPAVRVPIEQKLIIEKCRLVGKPVVVATQMLDSMIRNPRATRAEISDIANAVIDHTDATMLSGETATGKYPVESVKVMAETITVTEESRYDDLAFKQTALRFTGTEQVLRARVDTAVNMALGSGAKAMVISSSSGLKVRLASSLRQELPIIAIVPSVRLACQLNLSWTVTAIASKSWNKLKPAAIKKLVIATKLINQKDGFVFLADEKNAGPVMIS